MNNKNNQVKSFSDQLAIKFLKNQGMDTIKNVQNFTKALDPGFMQYYLDEFDNLVSIYEPNTITRELKRKSKVCAKIYLSKAYLDFYNIDIDKALKVIEAFLHCPYMNNKNYNRIPTLYLAIRAGLSEEKINAIFMLCEILKLIKIKKDSNNNIFVKFLPIVLNDPWLEEKFYYFEFSNIKAYDKVYYEKKSIYHNGISITTYNKNIRKAIVEITIAFNELMCTDPVLRNTYYINGNRLDILYAICPIDLIAFMLGISVKKVKEELNKLCNKTNIVSKHDKVYVDTQGLKHYTNSDYKWFNKETITENTILEEGHPPVDEYSIIWHTKNLENSKYYKHYKKNKSSIMEKTRNALVLYTLKNYIDIKEETILTEEEKKIEQEEKVYQENNQKLSEEDIEKCENIVFNGYGSIVTLDKLQNIENKKFKPTLYNKETLDNMNVPKLINGLIKTMYSLVNCGRNALNYLIRQKNYITELIKQKVYIYSRDVNYAQAVRWKQEIEYLTSNQNENITILFEYIEVPLYIKAENRFQLELDSIMV